jgi:hypothetical protein
MLSIPPAKTAYKRPPKPRPTTGTIVAPLTLVQATYEDDVPDLVLVFSRAINIDAYDGNGVFVNDPTIRNVRWGGIDYWQLLDEVSMVIGLTDLGSPSATGVWLTAAGNNGIVAVDNGEMWDGCTELGLPFGT